MPFALAIIGIALLVAGIRDTQDDLFALVKGDFTGDNNFFYWVVSILIVGAIGYITKFKPVSVAFLTLLIVVLFLRKGGFFTQFQSAIQSTTGTQTFTALSPSAMQAQPLSALPNLANLQPLGSVQ